MRQSIAIAVLVGLIGCGGEQKTPPPADAAQPAVVAVAVADAAPPAPPPDAALVALARDELSGAEVDEIRAALKRVRGLDGEPLELPKLDRRPEADPEPVDGALTRGQVDRVIKARAGVLRACYQRELAKRPELAGKLTVAFTIAKDGTVEKAALDREASTLHDEVVEACVLRQFGKLRFPAASAEANVRYPLVFSAPR